MFDHLGDYVDAWLTIGRFMVVSVVVLVGCGAIALWRKI